MFWAEVWPTLRSGLFRLAFLSVLIAAAVPGAMAGVEAARWLVSVLVPDPQLHIARALVGSIAMIAVFFPWLFLIAGVLFFVWWRVSQAGSATPPIPEFEGRNTAAIDGPADERASGAARSLTRAANVAQPSNVLR